MVNPPILNLSSIKDENLLEYGNKIRKTILKWTGIPTSIGIATTKTLSKVANHIAKKKQSGVTNFIGVENIDPLLEKVDINDVWGVGKQLTKFYHKNGIYNAKQLKNKSNTWIKKSSNVLGSRTAMELRGISCIDIEKTKSKRKSCVVSRSFGQRVEKYQELNPDNPDGYQNIASVYMAQLDYDNAYNYEEISGFKRRLTWNTSLSLNTKLYGIVPINIGSLNSIRHKVTPQITLNYSTDLRKNSNQIIYPSGRLSILSHMVPFPRNA